MDRANPVASEYNIKPAWDWIDRILEVNADNSKIVASRHVLPAEWYFEYHFECFPIVPGVLLTEMMTQTAGHLLQLRVREATAKWVHFLLVGVNNARFYSPVLPGSNIELVATFKQGDDEQALLKSSASVDGKRVARAEVMLHRVGGDWHSIEQDEFLETRMMRILSDDMKPRYHL